MCLTLTPQLPQFKISPGASHLRPRMCSSMKRARLTPSLGSNAEWDCVHWGVACTAEHISQWRAHRRGLAGP